MTNTELIFRTSSEICHHLERPQCIYDTLVVLNSGTQWTKMLDSWFPTPRNRQSSDSLENKGA